MRLATRALLPVFFLLSVATAGPFDVTFDPVPAMAKSSIEALKQKEAPSKIEKKSLKVLEKEVKRWEKPSPSLKKDLEKTWKTTKKIETKKMQVQEWAQQMKGELEGMSKTVREKQERALEELKQEAQETPGKPGAKAEKALERAEKELAKAAAAPKTWTSYKRLWKAESWMTYTKKQIEKTKAK